MTSFVEQRESIVLFIEKKGNHHNEMQSSTYAPYGRLS